MSKRKCTFNSELQREYKFLKLDSKSNDPSKVICQHCGATFSISHGGKNDITQHNQTQRHKNAVSSLASTSTLDTFFKAPQDQLKVAASEALFAYHTVMHNESFRTNDCFSKLVKKLYEPKYASARTKSEAITQHVIAPYFQNLLIEDLHSCSSFSISLDASNRKDRKFFPVIVRYFKPLVGVKVKLLEFRELKGETSELQVNMLWEILEKHSLQSKLSAYCADNTNTNFGGLNRKGQQNVWRKLESKLGRSLAGIGCNAHIIHNAVDKAVDALTIDIENFAGKIYKHFDIHTARVAQLNDFCEFLGESYSKLPSHGQTRFLSLGPLLNKILSMFESLETYFLDPEVNCASQLAKFFSNPALKLYLLFVKDQLSYFESHIATLEKENITATETATVVKKLQDLMKNRQQECFLNRDARAEINKLEALGIDTTQFKTDVDKFYSIATKYIEDWTNSLKDVSCFEWALLKKNPDWKEIEDSLDKFKEYPQIRNIDDSKLFDQWGSIKQIICDKLLTWNENNIDASQRWVEVFQELQSKVMTFDCFAMLTEFIFSLPGTSAPVERIFSLMNILWTKEKSQLGLAVLNAILCIKKNSELTCEKFYETIEKDKKFLSKVVSSEKYNVFELK